MLKKRLPGSSSAASLLLLASPVSSSSVKSRFWLGLKVVGVMSALICLLAFVRIQAEYRSASFYLGMVRAAAEEAEEVSSLAPYEGAPKVAFLFLARSGLPLDFLWHTFFKGCYRMAMRGNFPYIYIRSRGSSLTHSRRGLPISISGSSGKASRWLGVSRA